jgi:hypothetical protein
LKLYELDSSDERQKPTTQLQALYRPDEPLPHFRPTPDFLRAVGAAFESPYPL